jgi:hypothetical protein
MDITNCPMCQTLIPTDQSEPPKTCSHCGADLTRWIRKPALPPPLPVAVTASAADPAVSDDSEENKSLHPSRVISWIVGGMVGFYCGFMLFIPLAAGMFALFLAKRLAPETLKPFNGALAIIFGHLAWMLVGALLVRVGLAPVIIDLGIMIAGLLWLVLRPGLGPVILLSIYEGVSLVVNIIAILQVEYGSVPHKALAAHIALRLFAIGALVVGYRQFKQEGESST